jgi:hypothetical protein
MAECFQSALGLGDLIERLLQTGQPTLQSGLLGFQLRQELAAALGLSSGRGRGLWLSNHSST